jgi:hypothetical protein
MSVHGRMDYDAREHLHFISVGPIQFRHAVFQRIYILHNVKYW